jgi:DNA-binding XRE family transcriptional regulator
MGRSAGLPQPPPVLEALLKEGIPRVRAQLAVQVATQRCAVPWTQSQLAARAKMNPVQIAEIELGKRDPSFTTVVRIADVLKLHALDELLGDMPLGRTSRDLAG